jgi:non-specific serine/threonine protein kinase/serine/threonine-protein kinase
MPERAENPPPYPHIDERTRATMPDRPAAADAGDLLEGRPAFTEGPGAIIGRYKILQVIGEGGFGTVYMAEQQEPVRRLVALKIIKLGMDTRQVVARFEAERQALAMMDHPNIAKVLDGGATESGRPYFVMELVKGISITQYADQANLSMHERLLLFIPVAQAVQHAHQKGIIHRDLKPSNVLVTLHDGKPVPKVIDFGIAKATNQRLTEKTLFTEYRQFIGTPAYMSPEQAEMSGLDIDTRSDIYSLGVLLYELLTGMTPFDAKELRSAAVNEIQRIIREVEPPRPSTRLSTLLEADAQSVEGGDSTLAVIAKRRHTDPRTLTKLLRGDLDWIVMKCLEKDRTRRYETADALAKDVQRYLQDEPVSAGPPSAGYRVRKFIRRHRARVVAAAALGLVLLLGLAGTTMGLISAMRSAHSEGVALAEMEVAMKEARSQKEIAEAVNDFLNNELLAAVDPAELGRDATVREVFDLAASRIDQQFAQQPLVLATLHHTMGKTYLALGELEPARRHAERAAEIRRRELGPDDGLTIMAEASFCSALLVAGEVTRARPILEELHQRALRVLSGDSIITLGIASNLGVAYTNLGEFGRAEELLRETLATEERVLGEDHPQTVMAMGSLANLLSGTGHSEEAEKLYLEGYERQKRSLGPEHPDALISLHNLADMAMRFARYDEAEERYLNLLEIRRRELTEDHPDTIATAFNLGLLYRIMGRHDEAGPLLEGSWQRAARVMGADHPDTLRMASMVGRHRLTVGQAPEAETLFVETLDHWIRIYGPTHPHTLTARADLMELYRRTGQAENLAEITAKHLHALAEAGGRPDADAETLNTAAWELATAEPTHLRDPQRAVEFAIRANDLTGNTNGYFLDTLSIALAAAGRYEEAIANQERALSFVPEDDPGHAEMQRHLDEFNAALDARK